MTKDELKSLREHFGYTITQAAAFADVSAATWARWETGRTAMNVLAVKRFAIAAKQTAEQLGARPVIPNYTPEPAHHAPAKAKVNTATMSDVDRMLYEGGLRR